MRRSVAGGALASIAMLSAVLPPLASGPASAAPIAGGAVRVVLFLERQRDDLGAVVLAVSDPASRSYGRYRSVSDVAARYGASPETIGGVVSFLSAYGVEGAVDVTGTFVSALLDPEQVQAVFGADPGVDPPVPAELEGTVTGIVGTFRSEEAAGRTEPLRVRSGPPPRASRRGRTGRGSPARPRPVRPLRIPSIAPTTFRIPRPRKRIARSRPTSSAPPTASRRPGSRAAGAPRS